MRNYWTLTVLLISLMLGLASCKSVVPVIGTDSHEQAELHTQRDSVYVYERDSIFIMVKGDTVWMERWHTRYRDRWRGRFDSVYIHDSIDRPVPVTVKQGLTGWQHFQIWTGRIVMILLLLYIAFKVVKRYLKPF